MPVVSIQTGARLTEIGGYSLNADIGLVSGSAVIKLRPKVAAAVSVLIENRFRFVPRDEIATAVWGAKSEINCTGNALDQVLKEVRRGLQKIGATLERSSQGYKVSYTAAVPSPPTRGVRIFRTDELRNADLCSVGGIKPMMPILIVGQRPLELSADFASATMRLLDRVTMTYILPAQSSHVPRLLLSLSLHEYLSDSARLRNLNEKDRELIAQRWQLLRRHLRVAFSDIPLPCHWQIYNEDDSRAAVAVLVPPNSEDCVLSAWDQAASDMATTFRSMASASSAFVPLEAQEQCAQHLTDLTGTPDLATHLMRIP